MNSDDTTGAVGGPGAAQASGAVTRTSTRTPWRDRAAPRLAAFAVALVVLFTGGWSVGALAGPDVSPTDRAARHSPDHETSGQEGAGQGDVGSGTDAPDGGHATHDGAPSGGVDGGVGGLGGLGGLEVSREGYALETIAAPTTAEAPGELVFRVTGPTGAPVTAFTPTHDKALHLIVVRRDMAGFQHLHPEMSPDGTWRTPITLAAGDHRVLADFAPDARTEALTLGHDLPVAGDYRPALLPAPSSAATTPDGYAVTVAGGLTAGTSSPLRLTVTKDGAPVGDLQPYLAAYGHLVALRAGDLAYLHMHPEGAPGDGRTPPGPDVTFIADVPTPGAYRLYLDFAHQGAVRTVEFTALAGPPATGLAAASPAHTDAGHGH